MILNQKETTVAYRCPSCGLSVMSMVGVFALSGDMMKLKCPCGESELVIAYTKDKKVRLTVPCLLCPKPHNHMISGTIFFGRDIFTLPCAFSGINMCFIGKQADVMKSMEETEAALIEMLGDAGTDNLDSIRDSNKAALTDPQIVDIVIFVIRDLESEGKIKCRCLRRENIRYNVDVGESFIEVSCPQCEAFARFPTDSLIGATSFLQTESIELT
jgi:hypothetical protein